MANTEAAGMADDEGWDLVARAIADRLDQLGLTQAEFLRTVDLSDTALNGYLSGKPVRRKDKARELCAGLGWMPQSIDIIRRGGEAVLTVPGQRQTVEARLDRQDEVLAAILAGVRELLGRDSDAPR